MDQSEFAKELIQEMGVDVFAPTEILWILEQSDLFLQITSLWLNCSIMTVRSIGPLNQLVNGGCLAQNEVITVCRYVFLILMNMDRDSVFQV